MVEKLSKRLKELRGNKTQQEVAKDTGITAQSIGRYEGGGKNKRSPGVEELVILADYYNVSTDYLLGRTDIKTRDPKIREISDYTGLSESAIQALNSNIVNGRFKIGGHSGLVLSSMLSNKEVYYVLDNIYKYIHLLECFDSLLWLINFFVHGSWQGLFNDISDIEIEKIISIVKEFILFISTYNVKEQTPDTKAYDNESLAGDFVLIRDSFYDNKDLLSFRLSKIIDETISNAAEPIPINYLIDEFEEALKSSGLSVATIEKIISQIREELLENGGD